MTLTYLWNKLLKRLPGSAVRNCQLEQPAKIEPRSTVIHSSFGRYSYCGYDYTLINCKIGRFCSISDHVSAGLASHPMEWVSTSPAFYRGRDSIPKDLATLDYDLAPPQTNIGHDVWIGSNVCLKAGITIGNGAVIGMGSVVTKDVPPYAVAAGNPARVIRMRFPQPLCQRLNASHWWEQEPERLKALSHLMNDPEGFLEALEATKP